MLLPWYEYWISIYDWTHPGNEVLKDVSDHPEDRLNGETSIPREPAD